jgi:hypothetical protein
MVINRHHYPEKSVSVCKTWYNYGFLRLALKKSGVIDGNIFLLRIVFHQEP